MTMLPEPPGTTAPPDANAPPDATAPQVPEGWEGILAPGERILWQGQPDATPDWSLLIDFRSLFGLLFTGFAVFWTAIAVSMLWSGGSNGPPLFFRVLFPLFGVPFVLVGLGTLLGPLRADLADRRGAFYTLTDRAAFIATQRRGVRKLDRHPLDRDFRPVLEDGSPGTVWFSDAPAPATSGAWTGTGSARRYAGGTAARPRAGFRRIPDAREVYAMILAAQRATAAGPRDATP